MFDPRKKIAILVSGNLLPDSPDRREDVYELDEEVAKLTPAFAAHGMDISLVNWRDAAEVSGDYAAMLPLFVWDYFEQMNMYFLKLWPRLVKKPTSITRLMF